MHYQLYTANNRPWGSPVSSAEQLLRLILPIHKLMLKLGFTVRLV